MSHLNAINIAENTIAFQPMQQAKNIAMRVKALSGGYGDTQILNDIELDVPKGKITILVGPNGCGKSTLLKTMARVLEPTKGEVLLGDKNVHQLPTKTVARELALLAQGPVAPEGLTVRELVAQGRFPHQTFLRQWSTEDAKAVDDAMAATDVAQFADRPVSSLSGGQRQRCWIAMSLAQDTDVILLDEPTTFLDLKVQVDVMNLLTKTARDTNKTMVVVLHELNIAAAFADKLVMMRNGQILADGAVDDVFTSENLNQIFGLNANVLLDQRSGRPVCVPMIAN
jgi:iron complex transport system ATP-binding protein